MKKILALSLVALAAACTSPSDNLCLKQAECQGEDDPAQWCTDAKEDRDEDAQACADKCAAENDAYASCCLTEGSCDEIEGTDLKIFCAEAAGDACKDQAEAAADCAADC